MEQKYINEYHRTHSLALQEEVRKMSQHPLSCEEARRQIAEIKKASEEAKTPPRTGEKG